MTDTTLTSKLHPGDAAYDDARALWNGMFDKRPAVIARREYDPTGVFTAESG